jgi:type I restriction enzyme, R subunit
VQSLPKGIQKSEEAVAETIENNVRKLIINESPVDPAYYDKMSKLLDALIEQRRKGVVGYKEYLEKIAQLAKEVTTPGGAATGYPASLKTGAQRALFNNLGKDETLTLATDKAIQTSRQDGWKDNAMKAKRVRLAIRQVLLANAASQPVPPDTASMSVTNDDYAIDVLTTQILELARHQNDY